MRWEVGQRGLASMDSRLLHCMPVPAPLRKPGPALLQRSPCVSFVWDLWHPQSNFTGTKYSLELINALHAGRVALQLPPMEEGAPPVEMALPAGRWCARLLLSRRCGVLAASLPDALAACSSTNWPPCPKSLFTSGIS